jgi:hypothetical protein
MPEKKSAKPGVSAYTARMPAAVRDVMKELAHVTEISMNRITYDCVRANLKAWAVRELSGELIQDDVTHAYRSLSLTDAGRKRLLAAIDSALAEGDAYWSTESAAED